MLDICDKFQAHVPYVGRNNRRRAMYKLTNPQATNNPSAFSLLGDISITKYDNLNDILHKQT